MWRIALVAVLLQFTYLMNAQDRTPPTAVCESVITVSLSYGRNYITASEIDRASYDNVGITRFRIRRMDDPCNIPSNLTFGERIELCCDDISTTFMVVLQVEDAAGNIGQCMTEVRVQDKTTPRIECLPDITVSCKFRSASPSTFGSFTQDPTKRNKIIVGGRFWGLDGLYSGGCGLLPLQESSQFIKGNCHQTNDQLIRRFFFPQFPGQECIQTITFVPESNFEIRDQTCFNEDPTDGVIWPCDYETRDCDPQGGLSPDVTGRPVLVKGDQCGLIATNYHDQRFDIAGTACTKIIREWTVFDWCAGNQWRYTQVILVYESNPPVIENCRDTVLLSNDHDCRTAVFSERINVSDDCTPYDSLQFRYKLDVGNDGTLDTMAFEDSLSVTLPFGEHTLYWDIDDGCSNVSSCARIIRVVDGKKPTPVCRDGLVTVIMPVTGQLTIHANSLNLDSYDNCTPEENLQYSFTENIADSLFFVNCDSLTSSQSDTFNVSIYVTDESGLKEHCKTRILIQDPNQVCSSTLTAQIRGQMITPDGNILNGVMISVKDSSQTVTLDQFETQFNTFEKHLIIPSKIWDEGLQIVASKHDEQEKGISVADLVILQRHLLGQERINDPEKWLAGDVNGSGEITARDLVILRRMILGLIHEFPDNTPPWYFINNKSWIEDKVIESSISLNNVQPDSIQVDLKVIKTGDMNNSWGRSIAEIESRTTNDFIFYIEKNISPDQSLIAFSLKAEDFSQLQGFQGTFEFDPGLLEFVSIVSGALNVNQGNLNLNILSEGFIPFVWDTKQGINISPDEVLFTLFFRSNRKENPLNPFSLDFGSSTISAQGVNSDGEIIKLIYKVKKTPDNVVTKTQVLPAFPNPGKDFFTIPLQLSNDDNVQLAVFNAQGQRIYQNSYQLVKGNRSIQLAKEQLGTAGVYLIEIQIGDSIRSAQRIMLLP